MRSFLLGLAAAATLAAPLAPAAAAVVYTVPAQPLITADNTGGGLNDGTGVWFNPLTGYAESRGFFFPDTLFADGQFFLLKDTVSYGQPEAEVFVQGFFSRGNGVIYAANMNPAKFGAGEAIGPGTGVQSPGSGFPDLGPVFGNWAAGDRGFLGLTIRDASGNSAAHVFYGFADVTVNDDYSLTLNGFAYENVRGAAITTFFAPVPEPASALLLAGGLGLLALRRRRSA